MPNIEIKARLHDRETVLKIAQSLGEFLGTDHQIDTYFCSPSGRLKLRESTLSGAQLVPYMRLDQNGPKRSDYLVVPVADPALCKRLFSDILGVDVVVDKVRTIYHVGNVRVHIDDVKGLGDYFEFEAVYDDPLREQQEREKVKRLLEQFEIREADLLEGSYREMVKEHTRCE